MAGAGAKPWFVGEDLAAFVAYWDLFEARQIEVMDAVRPEIAGLAPTFANEENVQWARGSAREMLVAVRQAIVDGDWTPVDATMEDRAAQMARLGVRFDEWTDLLLLTQRHTVPLLVATHAANATFLALVLAAMHDFWRRAIRTTRLRYTRIRDAMDEERGKALQRSERVFRAIVETSPDAVSLIDRDGKFLYASPAAAGLAGREGAEMVGRSVFDLIAPRDLEAYKQSWQTCIDQPGVRLRHTFRMASADGAAHYRESLRVNHLDDPNIGAIVTLVRDVTETRRLEEQLLQSQKMEAIGTLAGGVAHDFNNLLSVIIGYCELVLGGVSKTDPMRAELEEIRDAGERAAALTGQLLAFSRKQVRDPRIIRLATIATGMDRMIRRLIGEHIELVALTADSVGNVLADPGQMEQVLLNLVINARDAMPEGGKLVVETADVDVDARHAAGLGIPPGPHVMMAVSDNGTGMDAATVARVFEPFFTTKPDRGTGLGLSTVFGIVRQSGGAISVYSEPGQGTTFRVYLPRTDAVVKPAAQVAPSVRPRGTETILLVEDADAVRNLAREILRRQGYHVIEASNPGEALLVAEQHATPIHLLVTDVVMPKMTGRELARRLVASRPSIKVLYMSGYTERTIVHNGVLETGIAFVPKPFTPDSLLRKVREVLDG